MGERLFSPKSLERVARVVEWEDVVTVYRDGTTNQQRYMQAIAELYERWMRGWSFPDFAYAFQQVQSREFLQAFIRIVDTFAPRISQLRGFWEGIWYGANPGKALPRGFFGMPEVPVLSDLEQAGMAIRRMMNDVDVIVTEQKEEGEG